MPPKKPSPPPPPPKAAALPVPKAPPGKQHPNRWLREETVAEMLDCGLSTLRNDRSEGRKLPYYKFGKSVRYLELDVLAYMEANRIEARN